MRAIPLLLLLLAVMPPARAQQPPDGLWAGAPKPPDPTIRLTVPSAAEPSPALKYPLLPQLREQSPGNAALLYYHAFSPDWITHRNPEESKKLDVWRNDTSKKPGNELKWVRTYKPLDEVDRAARRAYCDWEQTERMRREGISMLLPDVQSIREFANLLSLRARFEMEAGEHDKVIRTLQTGLTLARHTADAPTLIQALVGVAIGQIELNEVDRWLEKPGAPNLYWSLTALPSPFIDMRKPLQGERLFIDSLFPSVRESMAEKKAEAISLERMQATLHSLQLAGLPGRMSDGGLGELGGKFGLALYAAKVYPEAKKALLAQGWKPEVVEQVPVTQAALILEVLNYDRIYDDMAKWYGLPFWQARPAMVKALKDANLRSGEAGAGLVLARLLMPAMEKVMFAGARIDRKIAALRTIEALRLHAAAKGAWPEKLENVTVVPIPDDPVTGKPFEYRVDGDRFTLSAPAPAGEQANPGNSIRYEITLKK